MNQAILSMERVLNQGSLVALSPGIARSFPAFPRNCLPVCQARWSFTGVEKSGSGSFPPFEAPKFGGFPVGATGKAWDSNDILPSPGTPWEIDELEVESRALVRIQKENVNLNSAPNRTFQTLSEDMAMGLVLRAASGTGWTTGSGLEGPSNPFELKQEQFEDEGSEQRWPLLSKSPRRRMRVAFTCNICGERTTRAINPHAYTDGTVFVQCAGCDIFHKLVDNLKLFHELQGRVFPSYGITGFSEHAPYDFLGLDDSPLS